MPRTRLAGEFKLEPKQIFDFVGYQSNLRAGWVRPTLDCWQNFRGKILEILSLLACLVQQFMSVIGLLTKEKQAHLGRPHMRPIQWHLKKKKKKQLEGTRVTRKGDYNTKVLAPTFTVVAARGHWPYRLTITPNKTCSTNLFRHMKRRVGSSLKPKHCKRHLVPSEKLVAYQLSRAQGSLSGLKRVPRPLHTQDTTCRHEVGPTLCSSTENLDRVHQKSSNSQSPTHSRPANKVADKLSKLGWNCPVCQQWLICSHQ